MFLTFFFLGFKFLRCHNFDISLKFRFSLIGGGLDLLDHNGYSASFNKHGRAPIGTDFKRHR